MRSIGEGYNQICLKNLAANRGSVFAIQRHVKDTNAELLRHISLQLKALDHARLDPTVVVTNRQQTRYPLCVHEYVTRMHYTGP